MVLESSVKVEITDEETTNEDNVCFTVLLSGKVSFIVKSDLVLTKK
jgi:hypothetical protein